MALGDRSNAWDSIHSRVGSGAAVGAIFVWLSVGCSVSSTPSQRDAEAPLTARQVEIEAADQQRPMFALTFSGGARVPLDRVVVDFFEEDPILTTRFEAEILHRDRGVTDVEFALKPPPSSLLVSLSVFDGVRWHDAGATPREADAAAPRGPNDLQPAYRAKQTEDGVKLRLHRVAEGATVKVRGELSALRSGPPSWWSSSALCDPPARAMSVRTWSDGADPSLRSGPPRPTWTWDGVNASGPPMMWEDHEPEEVGVADERLSMVRFMPVGHDHAEEPKTLAILVDTSASQSASFERNIRHLHGVLGTLRARTSPDLGLWVVAFDQTAKTIFRGDLRQYGDEVLETLLRRGPLGATNLEGGLRFLGSHGPESFDRLLLVSDGVVTAGGSSPEYLGGLVRALESRGLRRLDAFAASSHSNTSLLGTLVDQPPRPGVLLSREEPPQRAAARLLRTVGHVLISSPNTPDIYPSAVARVQAGDEVMVAALRVAGDEIILEAHEVVEGIRRTAQIPLRRRGAAGLSTYGRVLAFEQRRSQIADSGRGGMAEMFKKIAAEAARRGLFNGWTDVSFAPRPAQATGSEGAVRPEGVVAPVPRGVLQRSTWAQTHLRGDRESLARAVSWREKASRRGPSEILDRTTGVRARESGPAQAAKEERARTEQAQTEPTERGHRPVDEVPVPAGVGGDSQAQRPVVEVRAGFLGEGSQAHRGTFSTVISLLGWGDEQTSSSVADAWMRNEPANLLSILAVAVVEERTGNYGRAGRAFGSLIDLYPHRDDVRRFAARSLVRLGTAADRLSHDALQRAERLRPMHPTSARALAVDALARGHYEDAATLLAGLVEGAEPLNVEARGEGARSSLRAELGMVLAGWRLSRPEDAEAIATLSRRVGVALPRERTVLVALGWDAASTDMDLHLRDARGNHAYYRRKALPSGGALTEDASGAFPYEAFVLPAGANAAPYEISVEIHDVGPLGVATGAVDILSFDPVVGLRVEQRPFLVTRARSSVNLGELGLARAPARGHRSRTRGPEVAKR